MNKANILLIKDVARISGQSIHTVKYYLRIGLIAEIGRSPETHFRYFDSSTLHRLVQIRHFRKQHKSIREIHGLLSPFKFTKGTIC